MKNIVVVDDHQLFRLAITSIINKEESFKVTGEYACAHMALKKAESDEADLYLLDIDLEEGDGFEIASQLRKKQPKAKLVILSSHKEAFYLVKSLESKVDGYIHKNSDPDELVKGLKKVLNGSNYFSSEISDILINKVMMRAANKNSLPKITNRELEIVKYLTDGLSSREISEKLSLSTRTIETHRRRILEKFGLKNTAELVKLAITENLV